MLEQLLSKSAYIMGASVTAVLGAAAVREVVRVAHAWAGHILTFSAWSN